MSEFPTHACVEHTAAGRKIIAVSLINYRTPEVHDVASEQGVLLKMTVKMDFYFGTSFLLCFSEQAKKNLDINDVPRQKAPCLACNQALGQHDVSPKACDGIQTPEQRMPAAASVLATSRGSCTAAVWGQEEQMVSC